MRTKHLLQLFFCLLLAGCSNNQEQNVSVKLGGPLREVEGVESTGTEESDSLIAALATMKTDTLDCSANAYWEIIGKGKAYIPALIESLTDTTLTNIYNGCKEANLNIGEVCYFALSEIGDFPAAVVTQMQFCVVEFKNGWHCWSFHDYLFENKNKAEYQKKALSFYETSKFEFVPYPDSVITDCMKHYSIKGSYEWKR